MRAAKIAGGAGLAAAGDMLARATGGDAGSEPWARIGGWHRARASSGGELLGREWSTGALW